MMGYFVGRAALLLILVLAAGVSLAGEPEAFIARRGWHIDIGLRVEDLGSPLASTAAHLPQARYAFFGFADKHYLWRHEQITGGLVIHAPTGFDMPFRHGDMPRCVYAVSPELWIMAGWLP
jgi:hypothetical protein